MNPVNILSDPPDNSPGIADMELQCYEGSDTIISEDIDMQIVGETPLEMLD